MGTAELNASVACASRMRGVSKEEKDDIATKLALKVEKIHIHDILANVGIEPKTFALLARRSNQLS